MYYKVLVFLGNGLQKYIESLNINNISFKFDDKNIQDSMQGINNIQIPLEYPKDKSHGHFATPICFVLAKLLRTNPKTLAQSIESFLIQYDKDIHNKYDFKQMIECINPLNGYLNLTLSPSFLMNELQESLNNPKDFAKGDNKDISILLEYVSANPTGPLHIGHARGAIFGSVLQRIGNHMGYNIIGEYYVNDAGSQIDMLALSVYNNIAVILELDCIEGEIYKGDYIEAIAYKAIDNFKKDFFIQENKNKILSTLGIFAKDLMLQEIKNNLSSLDIEFDSFVSEKNLYNRWNDTLQELDKHNALLKKDGAIWLQSSMKGDEKDRVLVRDNGMPTYMAGDIIYHKDKFDRKYNHYINIWGADHHGYISRIKASIEFLGFDSNRLEVLLAQMVSLLKGGQPYKMSKRAGNFILIKDVVNDIGADSLKFVFLSKSLDTHLEFDVNDLNKEDASNPVFYINYANSRIHTLIDKSSFDKKQILQSQVKDFIDIQDDVLKQDCLQLILQSLNLFHVLNQSYNERALQKLCEYLKNLAKSLHTFYNAHRILQTPQEKIILKVLLLVSLSLTTGFNMLGINIKTKM